MDTAKQSIRHKLHRAAVQRMMWLGRMVDAPLTRLFLAFLIVTGIATLILGSYQEMEKYKILFLAISYISAFIFTIEFLVRLYVSPLYYGNHHWLRARKEYLTTFMGIIDFISILPFVGIYLFEGNTLISHLFDLGRFILIFKVLRYAHSFRTIQKVLSSIRYELMTSLFLLGTLIMFSAILMYYIERAAQPDKFTNIGEGFWWAIITITSVGYGDVYPITGLGKVLAGSLAITGLIAFSLPTALVSGAFMNHLQEERERKLEKGGNKKRRQL